MSEQYVPTTAEVRDEYMFATQEVDMDGYVIVSAQEAYARFDRWLAEVKAETLREAARDASGRWNVKPYVDQWLAARAARIAEEG